MIKKIIETPRLYLRELNTNDAHNFYELNLDPEVIKYTGDVAFNHITEAQSFLQNYNQYELYGFGRWAVIRKEDQAFLGWCGLKYSSDLDEVDLGFRFNKKYWNQGYATEASIACLNYGFSTLHLTKIVGRAMKANIASVKVLEKIGMKYTGNFDFVKHEGVLYEIYKS